MQLANLSRLGKFKNNIRNFIKVCISTELHIRKSNISEIELPIEKLISPGRIKSEFIHECGGKQYKEKHKPVALFEK